MPHSKGPSLERPQPPPDPGYTPTQRRVFDGTVEVVLERGFDDATVEEIVKRSGVPRAEFDRHFTGKEDACLQAFEDISDRLDRHMHRSVEGIQIPWRDFLRIAGYAAMRYFRDHEDETRFGMIELFRAGELAQARRENIVQRQVWLIDLGRQEMDDPDALTRSTAEVVVGSIFELVLKQLAKGNLTRLDDLVSEMMFLAVRPYLGLEAAREELTIPPPAEPTEGEADPP